MPVLNFNDEKEVKEYREFVENRRGTSFMQDLNWADVKDNSWDKEAVYIKEKGKIIASMLILIKKVAHTSVTFAYAPRGPVCDINDIALVSRVINEAEEVLKKHNAYVLKFDPQVLYSDELEEKYRKNGYKTSGKNPNKDDLIQPQFDGVLHLTGKTEEELMKSFAEKTRYNIRLAGRKGVTVRYSREKSDLSLFYNLYKTTTIRDNIGCREKEYFERMLSSYDENHLRIYIAEHEGEALSAAIATNYGGELYYVYGASSNEKRNLMPNYAMQMAMIRWGIETHCDTYNFGGILNLDKNDGLYKFKTGFCKEEGIEKYIGEIDKVYKKGMYFVVTKILPIYRKINRKIRTLKRKMEKKGEEK